MIKKKINDNKKKKILDQEIIRLKKIDFLKKNNIKPYNDTFKTESNSKILYNKFKNFTKKKLNLINFKTSISGRVISKRIIGKIGFFHIKDFYGKIQIYISQNNNIKDFEYFKKLDIGDIIAVKGIIFKTNTDELSLKSLKLIHLTKSLLPLPNKFYGYKDIEDRYRKRYYDLIINDNVKKVFIKRTKIIKIIRKFFDSKKLLEVETPILNSVLSGAAAKPFVTFYNALKTKFYLRIAPELYLKRLIVGGFYGVYEIGRIFRNEGISSIHNPEFSSVEAYISFFNMFEMMNLTEELFKKFNNIFFKSKKLFYQGRNICFKFPFKRIKMVDLIYKITKINFRTLKINKKKDLINFAKKYNIKLKKFEFSLGHIMNLFYEKYCQKKIKNPTFVYYFPVEVSPLAKSCFKNNNFVERFELIINGVEYVNAYSELNDPFEQKKRFKLQKIEKKLGNKEANDYDNDYIEALKCGLPPTGGIGIGLDRLVMLLTNSKNIKDVLLFPHLKKK